MTMTNTAVPAMAIGTIERRRIVAPHLTQNVAEAGLLS